MIKVDNLHIYNIENAIRGMRNPLESWERMDSTTTYGESYEEFCLGVNDLNLMKNLYKAGKDHRKYLRQMTISLDITAPRFWWQQFDTYSVGVTCNSESTMHCIHKKKIEMSDFSLDETGQYVEPSTYFEFIVDMLNALRELYIERQDKTYWRMLIEMLPQSFNQKRTITMNYEVAYNIYHSRKNHKLNEWKELCSIFEEKLPYFKIIMEENDEKKV